MDVKEVETTKPNFLYTLKDLSIKSLKDINFIAIVLVAIVFAYDHNYFDTDIWSRLLSAQHYLDNGWVLYKDIFSFADTKPYWADHEWLIGIIFYLILKFTGFTGLFIFKCLSIIFTMWGIYLTARLREDTNIHFFFLLIVLLALEPSFITNIRPHIITYMFFISWLFILEYSRKYESYKCLFILPVSMLAWVNLHAGCIAGIALVGVYIINAFITKSNLKPYIYVIITSIPLMFINPYTYHYFIYVFEELTANHIAISEWQPVQIFNIKSYIHFQILFFLAIVGYVFNWPKKLDIVALILLISFAVFGFKSARHTTLFALASGVFIYERLYGIAIPLVKTELKVRGEKVTNLITFFFNKGIAIFMIILMIPNFINMKPFSWKPIPRDFPINSINFIETNNLKGNILLHFAWGGVVSWKLFPNNKVAVDGRFIEVFYNDYFNKANDYYFAKEGWKDFIKEMNPDIILVSKIQPPLFSNILKLKDWKLVYEDEISAIFIPSKAAKDKTFIIPDKITPEEFEALKTKFR